jgi:flagellin
MNNRQVSNNLEKLSTGLRINRASDDAAGLAVSEGLRTQVRGAGQAKRNALDGISALNIAEGAMNEVHNILQRQRELAIQAATSTYSDTERAYMDSEFQALSAEIDRIGKETNFNGIKLFNNGGDPTTRTANIADIDRWNEAAVEATRRAVTTAVAGQITITAGSLSTQTDETRANIISNATNRIMGAMQYSATTGLNTEIANVNQYIVDAVNSVLGNGSASMTSNGAIGTSGITIGDMAAATASGTADGTGVLAVLTEQQARRTHGTNAGLPFEATRPAAVAGTRDGNISRINGENLWIGANDVRGVDSITVNYGGVASVNATLTGFTGVNAENALRAIDAAIVGISESRSDIGALVNRLESTINNLTTSIVNQQAAESQIRDVDFASEASKFTTNQILVQSATSMLSQANASTQGVLALLR